MPSESEPAPLTQEARDNLVDYLLSAAEFGLGESLYAGANTPQFIADNAPTTPHLAAGKAIARHVCRQYARGAGPGTWPGFTAAWGGLCKPYLDSINESPLDGELGRPFNGGQCPVSYKITFNATGASGACNPIEFGTSTISAGVGPISIRKFHNTAVSSQSGGLCPGFSHNVIFYRNANGESTLVGQGRGIRLNSISVSRVDGLPDNCGNTVPIFDPPNSRPGLPPLTPPRVTIPGIGPVTINPTFSPTGNVTINLPDVDLTVELPDPFKPKGEPSSEPGGGIPPGDIGSPGSPSTTGPGGDAEGVAPAGSVLVGVRVQILDIPESRARYTEEVYRGAYYVYMGTPGLLALHPSGAMVTTDQFTFASEEFLTAWRVRANDRWSIRVTPYYREV